MLKKSFFFLSLLIFPFLHAQSSSGKNPYHTKVSYLSSDLVILANGSVWHNISSNASSSTHLQNNKSAILLNYNEDEGYAVLSKRKNHNKSSQCVFCYYKKSQDAPHLKIKHIDEAITQAPRIYLSDDSEWSISSKEDALKRWETGDTIVVMPTADTQTFYLINACRTHVVAKLLQSPN